jgi:hypothetical protein
VRNERKRDLKRKMRKETTAETGNHTFKIGDLKHEENELKNRQKQPIVEGVRRKKW